MKNDEMKVQNLLILLFLHTSISDKFVLAEVGVMVSNFAYI